MKRLAGIIIIGLLLTGLAGLPVSSSTGDSPGAAPSADDIEPPAWECPIAAGIYYPSDGEVPDHPVRYYRVRCWPGCHTGSSYGMFPEQPLEGHPIFPTSTIDGHTDSAAAAE
jgi:hypothetical protein